MNRKSALSPKWFFQAVDGIALLVAAGLLYIFLPRVGLWFEHSSMVLDPTASAVLLIVGLPLWLLLLDWGGMYVDPVLVSHRELAAGMIRVSAIGLASLALVVFGLKELPASRLLVFSFGLCCCLLLTCLRFLEKRYYEARLRAGYYARRALVLGSPANVQLLQSMAQSSNYEFQVLPSDRRQDAADVSAVQAAFESTLRQTLLREAISEVLVIADPDYEKCIPFIIPICSEQGRALRIVPEVLLRYTGSGAPMMLACPESFIGLPSLYLSRTRPQPEYEFVKRLLDVVVSLVSLVVLSPLLAIIALAVKLSSPGPVLYRWHVLGQNNREFTGYKFRTMVVNADQMKADLLKYNEMTGPVFKMKHDPRITPVGRILRKYSLDELPQLWSVLKGDMSLVGPRPPLRTEFERFEFWQARKLSVKPGITCLWQISGRNEINSFDEWARLDLQYIDQRSLGLDLAILARTALAVLLGTGR